MPGGNAEDYVGVHTIFERIAARDFESRPCITYVGT
jgi:6-phosphogluconate dehydrogenase